MATFLLHHRDPLAVHHTVRTHASAAVLRALRTLSRHRLPALLAAGLAAVCVTAAVSALAALCLLAAVAVVSAAVLAGWTAAWRTARTHIAAAHAERDVEAERAAADRGRHLLFAESATNGTAALRWQVAGHAAEWRRVGAVDVRRPGGTR